MSWVKKCLALAMTAVTVAPAVVSAAWVPTGRDTLENPPVLTDIPAADFDDGGYAELHDNDNFTFYWQEDRDVLVIHDKRNGYTWKTGLDIDPARLKTQQNAICRAAEDDYNDDLIDFAEFEARCEVPVDSLTGIDVGPLLANSLVNFVYYKKGGSDSEYQNDTVYSSYTKLSLYDANSTLQNVDGDPTRWRFTFSVTGLGVDKDLDLTIVADVGLSLDGFTIAIVNDLLAGTCLPYLASISIAPFLGAVGGVETVYTAIPKTETTQGDWESSDDPVQKEMIGGYAFVPDGSGALIRFRNNSVSLSEYAATVYGDDPSQNNQSYRTDLGVYVPFKTASIPVFGIAHGNDQAAFVAYATEGAEYMQILSMPESNGTYYNYTFAKFKYNFKYLRIYTLDGADPVPSIGDEPNAFDAVMHYDFLAGDGTDDGFAANYVGMALKYKDHLIRSGELTPGTVAGDDIGLRLDFLMADAENSIVGYQTVVATTAAGVRAILDDVLGLGIANISSGLIGWQRDGLTLGDPTRATFSAAIGSRAGYRKLIGDFAERGVDISFYQDYYWVNEEQLPLYRNVAKHPAGWYGRTFTYEDPVGVFYYARPVRSAEWFARQASTFRGLGATSLTADGMTDRLVTDYTGDGTTRTEAIALFRDAFAAVDADVMLNLTHPNGYLFKYTDRYLQMDVYATQYLIETDTVPFLQIVLQNTMELYAIYSNFSFYTQADVLRMIDYNVWPSFVLTMEPSYILSDTNSSDYYSTEYELYRDAITTIYAQVNGALSEVLGASWTAREVLHAGVVRNTYDNGVEIVVNYTDRLYDEGGLTVPAASYVVLGGE